jgi:hypothetical protein
VCTGGIVRLAFFRHDFALTGEAALQLVPDFLGAALFQWIGTTDHKSGASESEPKR